MRASEVREVFAQVLSDFAIPYTRVPVEPGLQDCPWLPLHLRAFYTQVEKDALESVDVFSRYRIRYVSVNGAFMSVLVHFESTANKAIAVNVRRLALFTDRSGIKKKRSCDDFMFGYAWAFGSENNGAM